MWCWIETTRVSPISSVLFPATFTYLDENTILYTSLSNVIRKCLLNMRDQVSHPFKTTYKKKSFVCFSYSGYQVKGQVHPVTCNENQEGE